VDGRPSLNDIIKSPNVDRVAREGVLFTHAFCPVPSCTPTRSAILTGQASHRLEHAANLWSRLDKKFTVYPDLLENAGYAIGYRGKGWSPGSDEAGGRTRNPAGPKFKTFEEFLKTVPADRPFYFWDGNTDTARHSWRPGAGTARRNADDEASRRYCQSGRHGRAWPRVSILA
jgi:arylsulfatase A-like enzyme